MKRNKDVAKFSAEPFPALDHRAIHDDSAAKTSTNDAGIEVFPLVVPKRAKWPQTAAALASLR